MSNLTGKIIKKRLRDLDKTQGWLAEKAEVSDNAVSKWIKQGGISRSKAIIVAGALEMSLDDLLVDCDADGILEEPVPESILEQRTPLTVEQLLYIKAITKREAELLRNYRAASETGQDWIDKISASAEVKLSPTSLSVVHNKSKL